MTARDISADLEAWRNRLAIDKHQASTALHVPYPTYRGWESGRACALPDAILALTRFIEADQVDPLAKQVSEIGLVRQAAACERIADVLERAFPAKDEMPEKGVL